MKQLKGAARTTRPAKQPTVSPAEDNRTVKEIVQGLVERLAPDCTWDDVLYKVYLCKKIAAGARDEAAGRLYTHEEVFAELEQ